MPMQTRFSSRNRVISEYVVVIYLVSRPKKKTTTTTKTRIPASLHENDELSAFRPPLTILRPAYKFSFIPHTRSEKRLISPPAAKPMLGRHHAHHNPILMESNNFLVSFLYLFVYLLLYSFI